ncbi:MAG: adenylyl-sulfate kinase [Tepidisphaerales bacterium]
MNCYSDAKHPMTDRGAIVWLTGLSGAGKSTLAHALMDELPRHTRRRLELLDGDVVRTHLSKGLGFSREDRDTNIRRIGWVADLVARHGGIAIVAAISPYRDVRDEIKRTYAHVLEVFVDASVEECARRDVKGLYARAIRGEIPQFTGVSDPYEPPLTPDVHIRTTETSVADGAARIISALKERGWV